MLPNDPDALKSEGVGSGAGSWVGRGVGVAGRFVGAGVGSGVGFAVGFGVGDHRQGRPVERGQAGQCPLDVQPRNTLVAIERASLTRPPSLERASQASESIECEMPRGRQQPGQERPFPVELVPVHP